MAFDPYYAGHHWVALPNQNAVKCDYCGHIELYTLVAKQYVGIASCSMNATPMAASVPVPTAAVTQPSTKQVAQWAASLPKGHRWLADFTASEFHCADCRFVIEFSWMQAQRVFSIPACFPVQVATAIQLSPGSMVSGSVFGISAATYETWRGSLIDEARQSTCVGCARELSVTLDAYYGRNVEMARYCQPCRTKLERTEAVYLDWPPLG